MTLSNTEPSSEPPGKPPAIPHGSTQPDATNVDDPTLSLLEKVQSVKEEVKNILETTTWPGKSAAVAQEFLNTIANISNLHNIPDRAALSSPDLQNDVQHAIQVLEDVRGRLNTASSKYGAGKRGILGFIKKIISWGANRSSRILRRCRQDVETVWTPLHQRRLENGLGTNDNDVEPSPQIPQDIHPPSSEATPGVKPQDNPIGEKGTPAKETGTTRNSIANPAPVEMTTLSPGNQENLRPSSQIPQNIHPLSSKATPGVEPQHNPAGTEQTDTTQNSTANPPRPGMSTSSPSGQKGKLSGSAGRLKAAGKIFSAVDAVSGLIPIVGSYVGAAAQVGSAVVEIVQKMDENEEVAKDLEERALKLSDLIGYFKDQSARTGGENVKAQIDKLERKKGY